MKIIILTSSLYGTASHHLDYLVKSNDIEIKLVIFNEGKMVDRKRYLSRKIKKMFRIGIIGTLNGFRMRNWFSRDIEKYIRIENLKEKCRRLNIPMKYVKSINSDETVELIRTADPDLGISLGNGYIHERVFSIPALGMLNIHHELLPQYQNAQSIIWQIYNESGVTGYTIHKIDKRIDTGDILLQESMPIHFRNSLSDTVTYTFVKLLDLSAKGLVKVLEGFEHYDANRIPQGKGKSYTTPDLIQLRVMQKQFKKLKEKFKIQ